MRLNSLFGTQSCSVDTARCGLDFRSPTMAFLMHRIFSGSSQRNTELLQVIWKSLSEQSRGRLAVSTKQTKALCEIKFTFTMGLYATQYDHIILKALIATSHVTNY